MILRAEKVSFSYRNGPLVLQEVSLELRPGTVTGLFGPNGSGKSTLLRCCNGSLLPCSGKVFLDEQPVQMMSRRQIARHIAVVPQETTADVPLTVRQVVLLGRFAHQSGLDRESARDREIADDCMGRLGIISLADRRFSHLSGGERQRTVIARALAQQPKILLMDEPNAHLDLTHQLEVYGLARFLAAEGLAVLIICHDLLISPLMVDAASILQQGRLVKTGPCRDLFTPEVLGNIFATGARISWPDPYRIIADFQDIMQASGERMNEDR